MAATTHHWQLFLLFQPPRALYSEFSPTEFLPGFLFIRSPLEPGNLSAPTLQGGISMQNQNVQYATPKMATRTLAYCAMLAALQVVLARLIIPMPAADTRFSLEAIPVVLIVRHIVLFF